MKTTSPALPGQSGKKGLLWGFVIFVLFCQLLAHTWIRNQSTQALVDISKAQDQLNKVLAYNRALGIERGRLKSEARVVFIAKDKLGLHQDIFDQIVYLGGERTF